MIHPATTQIHPNSFVDSVEGIPCPMVFVEGGTFWMGAKEEDIDEDLKFLGMSPPHQVTVSDFAIGQFPVTQALWEVVMGDNPSFFRSRQRPVEQVYWEEATAFCEKLSQLTGRQYGLPTEAQWAYAARGGRYTNGFIYAGSNHLEEVAWYEQNSYDETKPVGLKYPNELGLYDCSGNVWEWCQDLFSSKYYQECQEKGILKDPMGPEEDFMEINGEQLSNLGHRVFRGGGWSDGPRNCRVAIRVGHAPEDRHHDLGFRLAALVSSPSSKER